MDSFYILIFMVLLLVFYCFVVKSVEGISPTDGSKTKTFKSFKETSRHRVLVLDERFKAIQDIDYFDFYEGSSSMNSVFDTSKLVEAKSAAQKIISEDFNQSLDHEKLVAKETLNKKKDAL